jgi:hypothetical protein
MQKRTVWLEDVCQIDGIGYIVASQPPYWRRRVTGMKQVLLMIAVVMGQSVLAADVPEMTDANKLGRQVGGLIACLLIPAVIIGVIIWVIIKRNRSSRKSSEPPQQPTASRPVPPQYTLQPEPPVQAQASAVEHMQCYWCSEEVIRGARVCKHCGRNPAE